MSHIRKIARIFCIHGGIRGIVALLVLTATTVAGAQIAVKSDPSRMLEPPMARPDTLTAVSVPAQRKPGLIDRVINYFKETNREPAPGRMDFSFLGGPSYSSATSLELAVIAAGVYRTGELATTPLSELDIFAEGSVTGFYNVGIRGHHSFPNDRFRINYHANFCHFPSKFWGVGYAMDVDNNNETEYTLLQSLIRAEFLWHLPHDVFLGPSVCFDYSKAIKVGNPLTWGDEDRRQTACGVGFILSLDTRDFPQNATRGVNIKLHQRYIPRFKSDKKGFSITELTFAWYKRMWRSGVVALQFHGAGSTAHTPWSMLPTLDSGKGIRGYYEGRYRDRGELDITAEVRQHLWGRNGLVVWGGVGTIFHRFDAINLRHLLPSVGVGYRWEFKKGVNVRVDIGFGKHSHEFTLGLNEVF